MNDIKRFLNKPLACYGAVIMGAIGIINLLCMIGFVSGLFGAAGSSSFSSLAGSLTDALSMIGLVKILSWIALIAGIYMVVCSLYALLADKDKSKFWIILLVFNLYFLYANFRGTQLFGLLDDGIAGASQPSGYYSSLLEMEPDEIQTMVFMVLAGLVLMYVVGLVIGSYMYFHKVPLPGFIYNMRNKNAGTPPVMNEAPDQPQTPSEEEKAFCPRCGAPVTPDQRFCVKCGYALKASQEGSDAHE